MLRSLGSKTIQNRKWSLVQFYFVLYISIKPILFDFISIKPILFDCISIKSILFDCISIKSILFDEYYLNWKTDTSKLHYQSITGQYFLSTPPENISFLMFSVDKEWEN